MFKRQLPCLVGAGVGTGARVAGDRSSGDAAGSVLLPVLSSRALRFLSESVSSDVRFKNEMKRSRRLRRGRSASSHAGWDLISGPVRDPSPRHTDGTGVGAAVTPDRVKHEGRRPGGRDLQKRT